MARFCQQCGHELPEGKGFCPECGSPVTEETVLPPGPEEGLPPPPAAPQPPKAAQETPRETSPGAPTVSTMALESILAAKPESPVVSTLGFFGLEFLYKIPFVSSLCSLVLSIAPKNKNVRHHAQAKLLWKIVGFVLLIVFFLRVGVKLRPVIGDIWGILGKAAAGELDLNSLQDLDELGELGDLQSILRQYGVEDIGSLGDLQGVMESYGIHGLGDLKDLQGLLQEHGIDDLGDLQGYLNDNGIYEGLPGD